MLVADGSLSGSQAFHSSPIVQIFMTKDSTSASSGDEKQPVWKKIVAKYSKPAVGRGTWQLINTLVPYTALWVLMYLSLAVSLWLALPLAILAGAFLIRVFIIFHDCGHGSFFPSKKANDILG